MSISVKSSNKDPAPAWKSFISGETIIKNRPGNWLRRYVDTWGLVFTYGGSGCISLDKEYKLKRGDLTLMAPGITPLFNTAADWNILWFHFLIRPHLAEKLSLSAEKHKLAVVHFDKPEYGRILDTLREVHQLDLRRERGTYELTHTLLETVLLRADGKLAESGSKNDPRITLSQRLLTDPGNTLSIDEIADQCGMSRALFYAQFKREVGVSPRQYRENHIFRRAMLLLESTDLPVNEIAGQCGIEDAFYFSARFKKFTCLSPLSYRKKQREQL